MFYIIIIIFLLIFCEIRLFVFCSFGAVLKKIALRFGYHSNSLLTSPIRARPCCRVFDWRETPWMSGRDHQLCGRESGTTQSNDTRRLVTSIYCSCSVVFLSKESLLVLLVRYLFKPCINRRI